MEVNHMAAFDFEYDNLDPTLLEKQALNFTTNFIAIPRKLLITVLAFVVLLIAVVTLAIRKKKVQKLDK